MRFEIRKDPRQSKFGFHSLHIWQPCAADKNGRYIATIDEGAFTAEEHAANLPFRYAEAMHAALQNEFGRADPPPPPADLGSFAGVRIPDWFADKAQLLRDSVGKEARERTMAQNEAVAAFVAYCDAEGIALAARPAPDVLDP